MYNYLFISYFLSVLSTTFIIEPTDAARILAVFPTPAISHQAVFRPFIQALVSRGHELVVLTTDPVFPPNQSPKNFTEIDLSFSYTDARNYVSTIKGNPNDFYRYLKEIMFLLSDIMIKQLESKKVQNLIKDKTQKFDLIITEAYLRSNSVYSHLYKVPLIQVTSFGGKPYNYRVMGVSTHPTVYPTVTRKRVYNLSLWEKLEELIRQYKLEKIYVEVENKENDDLKRIFGNDTPAISELVSNIDMLFLNVHSIWEDNRPLPPNVIYLGGLHLQPEKKLPQDMKTYMDSSEHGVIYMSFGTNMNPSMLPPEKIQMFIKVFSKLPYDILWKWDLDELPNKPKNVRIGKWFPQSDLLRHPKLKLFITQGGLQSTDEAISAGVPVIGIPMQGDQYYNTEKYVYHNIGKQLVIDTLDEKTFYETIRTVIEDESYRKNVVRLRTLMQDQPMSPLDRAVWWTEYVLRHSGARHLRSPAANISWAQYLELELVAVLLIALCISATLVFLIVRFLLKQVLRFNSRSKRD